MKAIILVAGKGIRIRLKHSLPKCFLEINNEKLINRNIRLLREANIRDIIFVTGYKEERIKNECPEGIFITNPFYENTNTLVSLILGLTAQNFDEDIIIINGDTIFEEGTIQKLINVKHNAFAVKRIENATMEEVKVRISEEKIINIRKYLYPEYVEAIGIYKITPEFARDVYETAGKDVTFSNLYYEDIFDKIIRGHDVTPVYIKGEEIDTWEDYEAAKKAFQNE